MDLVVGVGNELRGDDGIGPRVVRDLREQPGVQTAVVHQLTPSLVDALGRAVRVLFVDADAARRAVELTPLRPSERGGKLGHALAPEELLGWTKLEHGACPEAWLLSVPARSFEFGEGFSPEAERALPLAHKAALAWIAGRTAVELHEEDK